MQDQVDSGRGARGHLLAKLFITMLVAVLLANVPLNRRRSAWVQTIPNATSIVIYEGIALQGSGPDIYILEDHLLRPFDSSDAYRYFRDRYHLVPHRVTDQLLENFGRGQRIHRLVTCRGVPHVYVLENGTKRRVDNPQHALQSSRWDTADIIACHELRDTLWLASA